MEKFIHHLSLGMALLSGLFLVLLTTIMFVDVIGRYVFSAPLTFAVELVELLMGLTITFGLAFTTLKRGHISVDFLTHATSGLIHRGLDVLSGLAGAVFFALVTWKLFEKGGQMMGDGLFTQILGLPVHPFVYLMSFASAAALVVTLAVILWPHHADTDSDTQLEG